MYTFNSSSKNDVLVYINTNTILLLQLLLYIIHTNILYCIHISECSMLK